MKVLADILEHKAQEVARRQRHRSVQSVRAEAEGIARSVPARGFVNALRQSIEIRNLAVIAEIKFASPSQGLIRADIDPATVASGYQRGGAAALSVLTDEVFFRGRDEFLPAARSATSLPCLRKDFLIEPYQVFESRVLDADCVLLIVAALESTQLKDMYETAVAVGLDVLVEVHDEQELERALAIEPPLVGINNRSLHTFEVSLDTSESLCRRIPPSCLAVAESGIYGRDDLARLQAAGIQSFLIGETLMRAQDPGAMLQQLIDDIGQ